MNKSELINEIAYITKFTKKEINLVLNLFIELIIMAIARDEKVLLVGFGSFRARPNKRKKIVKDSQGNIIPYLNLKNPTFTAGKFFLNTVNQIR